MEPEVGTKASIDDCTSLSVSGIDNVSVTCTACDGVTGRGREMGVGRGMGMGYRLLSFLPAQSHVLDFSGAVCVEWVAASRVSEDSAAASIFNWALRVFCGCDEEKEQEIEGGEGNVEKKGNGKNRLEVRLSMMRRK